MNITSVEVTGRNNCSFFYHLMNKQDPYSPTILKNISSLVLQIFLYLEAFECKTTFDWLYPMVSPIRSCVAFRFTNLEEKDNECS